MTTNRLTKEAASKILNSLDSVGNELASLQKKGILDPTVASEIIRNVDQTADKIQLAAFGESSFASYKAKISKVIKRDSDEPYMETFQNPQKPIKTDPDEPYMHKTEDSFNSKGIPTYDDDISSSVTDRKEYNVRDLSEWTDKTKKQPSWESGSAGPSTRQGSTQKTWAP